MRDKVTLLIRKQNIFEVNWQFVKTQENCCAVGWDQV